MIDNPSARRAAPIPPEHVGSSTEPGSAACYCSPATSSVGNVSLGEVSALDRSPLPASAEPPNVLLGFTPISDAWYEYDDQYVYTYPHATLRTPGRQAIHGGALSQVVTLRGLTVTPGMRPIPLMLPAKVGQPPTKRVIAVGRSGPAFDAAAIGEDANHIWNCDALTLLKSLPSKSVNCVVTSPPYWGLRDYGVEGQVGSEPTPQIYVARLVEVFQEVKRVLRDDGTCWINLGDCYANDTKWGGQTSGKHATGLQGSTFIGRNRTNTGLPSKSLIGMPWRVAFGLQDDGWTLRNEIIWHKTNVMPESVLDRLTRSHEQIFLFTKTGSYWFDQDAIREPQTGNTHSRGKGTSPKERPQHDGLIKANNSFNQSMTKYTVVPGGRNKRDVWSIPSAKSPYKHYATFPTALVEPMILAGCPEFVCSACGQPWKRIIVPTGHINSRKPAPAPVGDDPSKQDSATWSHVKQPTDAFEADCKCSAPTRPGLALDMFMGSGTVAVVARSLHRDYIGSDLNPEYVKIAKDRLRMPFEGRHIEHSNQTIGLPLFEAMNL